MDGQTALGGGRQALGLYGSKARFDRFERVRDGQARSRKDRELRKEFEKSGQLLSDQIIATAV
ncbi:MAG: hypothetical protein EBZ48_03190 [Proteobacteria bacterium]|nr:hypothetical protein [Pseudomonadota bacterium]